jgi:phytoene dehydrogenase-like protein
MNKKIIIIGSGIAGLSAGCYARMNGFETEIFEQHNLPGGLCTAWKRKDYLIDGCIHWLFGSAPGTTLHRFWKELGAMEGTEFVFHDELTRIETGTLDNKKTFIVYADADKLGAHMKDLAPEDAAEIDNFTGMIKRLSTVDMTFEKPMALMGMKDFQQIMKTMKPIWKDYKAMKKLSLTDYSLRFKSPHLRDGIRRIIDIPEFSAFALILLLSCQYNRTAGFPVGGSLNFVRKIEKRYRELGGSVRYSNRVDSVIVDRNKAVGVKLTDGSENFADIVISAADGYTTIFKMLKGRYINRTIKKHYDTLPLFKPFFYLSLGVNRDFSAEPHMTVRLTEKPFELEGFTCDHIGYKHYSFDPTLAPVGKSVLEILYSSDYNWWLKLKDDKQGYAAAKQKISDTLIGELEKLHPGIKGDIEVVDTATPLTFERFTGNRNGTYEGWLLTPKAMGMTMKKTLPGLKNFHMAGQWIHPGGGLSLVMKGSRDLIWQLCHKEGREFKTE